MTKYILAIDQGTTSSRCILFDKKANIRAVAQKEFSQMFPNDGWVEHDPLEIWSTQFGMLNEVLAKTNIKPSAVVAIGITNQRETTIVWDKNTGEPVYNAIVWQDRRTADICEELRGAGKDKIILEKTGLILDSYFSGTKIKWILDNVKGARARAEKGELLFGTVDTWLIWKLTGGAVHATDPSNASRTLLFNINTLQWDKELLDILEIPEQMLPEVKQSSDDFGVLDANYLGVEIPITGVAGDQQAATFGQACLKPGMAKNTYGTGCFLLLNIGKEPQINHNKILTTVAWGRKNTTTYALEGSVFVGGSVVQWVRDQLKFVHSSPDIEKLALSEKNNGGVYLVPAFVGLGAPWWDSYARGALFGLTRSSNQGHIARAALESIAFQSADVLKLMEKTANIKLQELRVDGGACSNDLLMQFQADILNVTVVRPKIIESTALGVAYLAGLYAGFWESAEEIVSLWQEDKVFEPKMPEEERQGYIENWTKAVKRTEHWLK